MRPIFLDVQVGDVVAVNPPREKAYLAQVLYVEGGAAVEPPVDRGPLHDVGAVRSPEVLDDRGALVESHSGSVVDQKREEKPTAGPCDLRLVDRGR